MPRKTQETSKPEYTTNQSCRKGPIEGIQEGPRRGEALGFNSTFQEQGTKEVAILTMKWST